MEPVQQLKKAIFEEVVDLSTPSSCTLPISLDIPVFLLSALTVQQKAKMMKCLNQLSFKVLNSNNWEDECTHLIVGYPSRSEKYLAACASGRWYMAH